LNEEMIKLILDKNKIEEFRSLVEIYPNPSFIAKLLLIFPKEISAKIGKNLVKVEEIISNTSDNILNLLNKKKISESDVKDILTKIVSGENFESAVKIEKVEYSEIEEKILNIINSKPGLSENAYMGLVMKEFKGKISGNEAMEIIRKVVK